MRVTGHLLVGVEKMGPAVMELHIVSPSGWKFYECLRDGVSLGFLMWDGERFYGPQRCMAAWNQAYDTQEKAGEL